jgi:hypothetical protein
MNKYFHPIVFYGVIFLTEQGPRGGGPWFYL